MLKDVCDVLELDNGARVKTRLDQQDLTTSKVLANDGKRYQTSIVNESGLYDVIFQSRTAGRYRPTRTSICLLYTSDAADE